MCDIAIYKSTDFLEQSTRLSSNRYIVMVYKVHMHAVHAHTAAMLRGKKTNISES